ncbi:hydroxypyruvate isomerase family protein [Silvibacterium sp.]|uniref:hydroxypyruvate isomerase family protein n=1 Tax=Silvibacterium sp. TaxID=1964179 RepID=UPI0039E22B4E
MLSRRLFLEAGARYGLGAGVGVGMGAWPGPGEAQPGVARPVLAGRIRQSVCRWCYAQLSVDELSAMAVRLGLLGVDLLELEEYEIPRRHGLICTMGYAGGGTISDALNRVENHAAIEAAFRKNIPLAAKAGVPNVITFSGNRRGMSDEQGAANTVLGLNRVKAIAEDHGVTICLELLNSKINHPDYMADRTAWGVRVMEEVASPRVKLLYDIYHMQIMEGDLIDTIRNSIGSIGHFHTGGVPGRHEIGPEQEIQYEAVMRAIAATGFQGYVAHEFQPTGDAETALRQAVAICNV